MFAWKKNVLILFKRRWADCVFLIILECWNVMYVTDTSSAMQKQWKWKDFLWKTMLPRTLPAATLTCFFQRIWHTFVSDDSFCTFDTCTSPFKNVLKIIRPCLWGRLTPCIQLWHPFSFRFFPFYVFVRGITLMYHTLIMHSLCVSGLQSQVDDSLLRYPRGPALQPAGDAWQF